MTLPIRNFSALRLITSRRVFGGLGRVFIFGTLTASSVAAPVSFEFAVEEVKQSPFLREISAEVILPSGRVRMLPAFFAGDGKFAVRARAEEMGTYRLGKIIERKEGRVVSLPRPRRAETTTVVQQGEKRPAVIVSATDPQLFTFSNGAPFTPIGANLPWPDRRRMAYFKESFSAFSAENLNWTRVWMAHWGALNLEWVPEHMEPQPRLGQFDLRVAKNWDEIIQHAEDNGVYLQLVLQHHGQYTTGANSNWKEHPWNVANGGFLWNTTHFFISPLARGLTAWKYRYIVARWGYSPAIMAWELFNEVHWTNALHDEDNAEVVAQWHAEMAAYLRSIDVYDHLVTTSLEDLRSAVYRSMDYLQPHMYAPDMLTAVRSFDELLPGEKRPVFYGEIGDDHITLPAEVKASGLLVVPPVWASLMGQSELPAQPWLGGQLIEQQRLGELGAVSRFLAETKLAERVGLQRASARTESSARVPFVLRPGQMWRRGAAPTVAIFGDGREAEATGPMPQILVGSPESLSDGFPGSARIRVSLSSPVEARLRVADAGARGAVLRVSVNGAPLIEHAWEALPPPPDPVDGQRPPRPARRPQEFALPLTSGENEVVLENVGGADWVEFESLDLRSEVSAIGAVGKRGESFAAFWLWRRDGVFARPEVQPADGFVSVGDFTPGEWRVTWWDTLHGKAARTSVVEHAGGELRLAVPAFSRHTAVVVERDAAPR